MLLFSEPRKKASIGVKGIGAGAGFWDGCGGVLLLREVELLELQCAELFELTHVEGEVFGSHVLLEGSLVLPCFADHENVGTGGAFKGVVSHISLVLERCGGQGDGGLKGFVVLALFGLEETIESEHKCFCMLGF